MIPFKIEEPETRMPPAPGCWFLLLDGDDVPFHEALEFGPGQLAAQSMVFNVGGQILPFDAVLRIVLAVERKP